MKKELFCEGVFIKNDINNVPCCIGDKIKVTRPTFYNQDEYFPETIYYGTLVLLKSKGIMLRFDNGGYYRLTLTNQARNPLKWELNNIKKHEEIDNSKLSSCHNDDPDDMCENCNCWKHTRMMCS